MPPKEKPMIRIALAELPATLITLGIFYVTVALGADYLLPGAKWWVFGVGALVFGKHYIKCVAIEMRLARERSPEAARTSYRYVPIVTGLFWIAVSIVALYLTARLWPAPQDSWLHTVQIIVIMLPATHGMISLLRGLFSSEQSIKHTLEIGGWREGEVAVAADHDGRQDQGGRQQ
jgi:hypothetical protein